MADLDALGQLGVILTLDGFLSVGMTVIVTNIAPKPSTPEVALDAARTLGPRRSSKASGGSASGSAWH